MWVEAMEEAMGISAGGDLGTEDSVVSLYSAGDSMGDSPRLTLAQGGSGGDDGSCSGGGSTGDDVRSRSGNSNEPSSSSAGGGGVGAGGGGVGEGLSLGQSKKSCGGATGGATGGGIGGGTSIKQRRFTAANPIVPSNLPKPSTLYITQYKQRHSLGRYSPNRATAAAATGSPAGASTASGGGGAASGVGRGGSCGLSGKGSKASVHFDRTGAGGGGGGGIKGGALSAAEASPSRYGGVGDGGGAAAAAGGGDGSEWICDEGSSIFTSAESEGRGFHTETGPMMGSADGAGKGGESARGRRAPQKERLL